MNAIQKMDSTVDRILKTSPTEPTSTASRGFTFILLLLAMFLVPALAISLLLLALIHMRRGDHLQSVLFGLLGCAMLVLLALARAWDAAAVGTVALPARGSATYGYLRRNNQSASQTAITDSTGSLWIFFGTDSGFEGKTELWYTRLWIFLARQ